MTVYSIAQSGTANQDIIEINGVAHTRNLDDMVPLKSENAELFIADESIWVVEGGGWVRLYLESAEDEDGVSIYRSAGNMQYEIYANQASCVAW